MLKALRALIGLAQRNDATAGELAPSLPVAEAELTAAHHAQAEADTAYRGGLLSSDEAALRRLVDARIEAGVRVDRATAIVGALRERLEAAEAREAEAARVERYDEARRQSDEAASALREIYPVAARTLVELIEGLARAQETVALANADLPAGFARLPDVEHSVRDEPDVAEELVSEVQVERWVREGEVRPGNFLQADVVATGEGRGRIPFPGAPLNTCAQAELRPFIERTVVARIRGATAYRLAERVALPGFGARDPALWAPLDAPCKTDEVLSQVRRLQYGGAAPEPLRQIETTLIPLPGAKPVAAEPSLRDTLARRA